MTTEPEIKDFDALMPPKRIAKVGGKEFDVSIIPAKASLEMAALMARDPALKTNLKGNKIESLIDMTVRVLRIQDDEVDRDWLLSVMDQDTLLQFCTFVLEPLIRRGQEARGKAGAAGKTGKNPRAGNTGRKS